MQELVERSFEVNVDDYSVFYIRLPYLNGSPKYFLQIIDLAKKFKVAGKKVVDAAIAQGELGEGKWEDYKVLGKAGLAIPKTDLGFKIEDLRYPLILKWIYGFKGQGTFLIRQLEDMQKIPSTIPRDELMVQEFLEAEYEYKVITVGYKSLPVVLRHKISDTGFGVDYYAHDSVAAQSVAEVVALAEKASALLKRELAKVDIIESKGKYYILEVNRWPGVSGYEELTGYNAIGEFVAYLR